MNNNIGIALLLTTGAGLSTIIGGFLGCVICKPSSRFMGFMLGFSGGVMLMVSFVELLQTGIETIGFMPANLCFFAGILVMFLVDYLIPHQYLGQDDFHHAPPKEKLIHTGLLMALGIGIHNFPEGMATFVGTLHDIKLGMAIAIAIAIHNIPEGLAVSFPVYAATGSRKKAFLWTFLSGVTEPIGALIAAAVLFPFLTQSVLGGLFAAVAGIMVFISLDELIPLSKSYGQEHLPIAGVLSGMIVMFLSLWLFKA